MIYLKEMAEAEFSEYKHFLIESYAQDISRNYQISIDEARVGSANQINEFLAQGLSTPNQYLYNILLSGSSDDESIGYLWLDVDSSKRRCYIYDIYLHEAFRGKGFGRQTLELIEMRMNEINIQRIGLNVFADNTAARDLYSKMGYQIISLNMQKWLSF
jgi:ribosomal protein S18 acetylase RimI-like enzyme